jgi:hypothetical protein
MYQLDTNELIETECRNIARALIEKNDLYGDSLHRPGIFGLDPEVGLMARIQDKLARIQAVGLTEDTEDTIFDLIGYLIHLRIARKAVTSKDA